MRILITNYLETTAPGGINKVVTEIARNLYKRGHEIIVLQANPLNLPSEEICEGFKILRVKSVFGNSLYGLHPEFLFFIKKYYKILQPDIIHLHGYHTLYTPELIFLFKKFYPNTPLVFSPHFGISSHSTFGGKYLWNPYNKLIGNRFVESASLILAASSFEANNIYYTLKVPEEKIKVMAHGVDLIDINENLKNKKNSINILYAGYLLKLKGVQYIIHALDKLVNQANINAKLTIIGNGPYEKNLKNLADKLNVFKNITWKGFMSPLSLIEEYKNADVFILVSMSENYGITVTEALAVGTPVIVTRIAALNEFLTEPGCFGVSFPPDPEELSNLIFKICSTDVKVGPFSDKIRTWDKVTFEYEKIYQDLLSLNLVE